MNLEKLKKEELIKEIKKLQKELNSVKKAYSANNIVEEELKFKILFDNSPTGILFTEKSGQIKYVNQTAINILGSPSIEATKSLNIYTLPNLIKAGISSAVEDCFKTAETKHFIKQYKSKWEKELWVNLYLVPLKNEDGVVEGVFFNFEDITEQKIYAEKIKADEERRRILIEANLAGIYNTTIDGNFIECNSSAARILGFNSVEEALKTNVENLYLRKSDRKRMIERLLAYGTVRSEEIQLKRNDGKIIWILLNALLLDDKTIYGSIFDITERKLAEEEIIKSKEFLNTTINAIQMPFFVKDINHRWVMLNDSAVEMMGHPREFLIGKSDYDIFPKEQADVFWKKDNYVFKHGKDINEEKISWSNGETRTILTSKFLYTSKSSDEKFVVGFIQDITEQKKIEETLRTSEELYRKLISTLPDMVTITDLDGKILFQNDIGIKEMGYENKEEIIGKNIFNFIAPQDKEKAINYFSLMLDNYLGTQTYFLLTKNNEKVPFEINGEVLRKDGQPYGAVFVSRNVNERKKIEEALKKSESQFRQVWNNSFDGMRLINEEGEIILINDAFCKLIEKSRDELVGKKFTDIYSDEDKDRMFETGIRRLKEKKVQPHFEKKLTLWNGKQIWFELSNSFIELEDKSTYLLSIFRNITERKLGEAKLTASELSYKGLFNTVLDAIYIQRPDGIFVDVNDGALKMYGYSREDFIGKTPEFLSAPGMNDLQDTIKRVQNAFLGNSETFEWWGKRKNGNIFPKEVVLTKGSYFGQDVIIATARDITERKEVEKKLKEITLELQQLNTNKDKFFSIVAHDLKSPFQGLLGYSELLLEDYDNLSDDEKKSYVKNISVITKNIFALVENLLEWSRLQTGRKEFQPIKIDLKDAAQEIINLLIASAIKKEISITNEISLDTFVLADAKMLNSILQNLLSNGIKFTMPGGEVSISSTTTECDVEINVTDTGIGIRQEDQEKLFRIDISHSSKGTAKEQGTGLGLILCKELVEKHGGKIWIESSFGKGTSIKFTLPIAR